ncbi:double-strand-break repair protein rad21-like protein 1 isoform X1 [Gadus chalcogrammus]|uniref:double-strand-break repair protein rad21-like protein 1 isoform X1 n=2 Tax=Gadus chalcogrammus TaxID=1042646 RepID=UPI0024C2A0C7|nr:double-strand-break repair protein rad21-like protein 1 isoform X1 [Gadus chalcogrammus]
MFNTSFIQRYKVTRVASPTQGFRMMFYTQLFSSKRDSLARVWLAAHWDRKVTKAHVFDCNLESTINEIISKKMKIGLRTSGHLLMGVVRIYSRKTKYLLADCSDALVKIKLSFRPGQTDLPVEGLEAAIESITLIEDFTAFDAQLPHPNALSVADNFSLNQSRSEEITLKEDFGRDLRNLMDFGDESQCHMQGLLDMRHHGDSFGDENKGYDLLDFLANLKGDTEESMDFITAVLQKETPETALLNIQPIDDASSVPIEAEDHGVSETTLLVNEEEGFALDPVAVTPTTGRRRGKRKRKRRLVVDQNKGLSNKDIREQLADASDLWSAPDMAPPTVQLMRWKESGWARTLFGRFSSTVVSSQLQQLFSQSVSGLGDDGAAEDSDPELMRKDPLEVQENTGIISPGTTGLTEELVNPEMSMISLMEIEERSPNNTDGSLERAGEDNMWEVSHQQLASEADSMFVNPTGLANGSDSETAVHTQSRLDSQDEKEKMTNQVLKLLHELKAQSADTFSLQAICEGGTRLRVAAVFFGLLVLQKEQAVELQQTTPYGDIMATPGSRFNHL